MGEKKTWRNKSMTIDQNKKKSLIIEFKYIKATDPSFDEKIECKKKKTRKKREPQKEGHWIRCRIN